MRCDKLRAHARAERAHARAHAHKAAQLTCAHARSLARRLSHFARGAASPQPLIGKRASRELGRALRSLDAAAAWPLSSAAAAWPSSAAARLAQLPRPLALRAEERANGDLRLVATVPRGLAGGSVSVEVDEPARTLSVVLEKATESAAEAPTQAARGGGITTRRSSSRIARVSATVALPSGVDLAKVRARLDGAELAIDAPLTEEARAGRGEAAAAAAVASPAGTRRTIELERASSSSDKEAEGDKSQ